MDTEQDGAYMALSSAVLDVRQSVYHDATTTLEVSEPQGVLALESHSAGVGVSPALSGQLISADSGTLHLDTLVLHLDRSTIVEVLQPWVEVVQGLSSTSQPTTTPAPPPTSSPPQHRTAPKQWSIDLSHVRLSYDPPSHNLPANLDLHHIQLDLTPDLNFTLSQARLSAGSECVLSLGSESTPALQCTFDGGGRQYGMSLAPVRAEVPLDWLGAVSTDLQWALTALKDADPRSTPPSPSKQERSGLTISCPLIDLTLPIPRHVPPSSQPFPSRAGRYHLILSSIAYQSSPPSTTTTEQPRRAHFAPPPTSTPDLEPTKGRLSIEQVEVCHSPLEGEQREILRIQSTTSSKGAIEVGLSEGGTRVHLAQVDLMLDPDRWAQLEMALDDLTCWSEALPSPSSTTRPRTVPSPLSSLPDSSLESERETSVDSRTRINLAQVRTELSWPLLGDGELDKLVLLTQGVELGLVAGGGIDVRVHQAGMTYWPSSPPTTTLSSLTSSSGTDSDDSSSTQTSPTQAQTAQTILLASPLSNHPCLSVIGRTSTSKEGKKTTKLHVDIRDVLGYGVLDMPFWPVLASLAQAPPDTFINVTPSDQTELRLTLSNVHLGLTASPPTTPIMALILPSAKAHLTFTPSGLQRADTQIETRILMAECISPSNGWILSLASGVPSVQDWMAKGFAPVFHLAPIVVRYRVGHCTVSQLRMRVCLAADTIAAVSQWSSAVSSVFTREVEQGENPDSPLTSSPRTLRGRSVSPASTRSGKPLDEDFFAPRATRPPATSSTVAPSTPLPPPVIDSSGLGTSLSQSTLLDLQDAVGSSATPSLVRTSVARRDALAEKQSLGSRGHTRTSLRPKQPSAHTTKNPALPVPQTVTASGSTRIKVFRPKWTGPQTKYYSWLADRTAQKEEQEWYVSVSFFHSDPLS